MTELAVVVAACCIGVVERVKWVSFFVLNIELVMVSKAENGDDVDDTVALLNSESEIWLHVTVLVAVIVVAVVVFDNDRSVMMLSKYDLLLLLVVFAEFCCCAKIRGIGSGGGMSGSYLEEWISNVLCVR